MPRLVLALFVAFQLLPSAALAFGREGHEVVAYIAYQCMSPATRIRVNHILSEKPGIVGPDLLVEAAYWPDALRSHVGTPIEIFHEFGVNNATGTFTFHYADINGVQVWAKNLRFKG